MKRIYLEITNACNLNCPFCTNQKGHDFLSLQQIDDYTSQIKKYCDYIYLHILGEPLLHPNFEEILNILDKKQLKLQLVTNGTLLNKYPNILNHSCLRKLSISIHSVNNLNISIDYFDTINNLIETVRNTNIELRFYDKQNLSNDLLEYLENLKKRYGFELTAKENSYMLKPHVYIYFEKLFNWPNINDPFISDTGKCHGGIDMLAINSKADVTLCCLDPLAYNKIGNLKTQSFEQIINSDLYKQICDNFKRQKITTELCQKCSYRLRF